ncbi:MAG: hypothetical protein QM723_09625 [Myxococcaceae bacterium]
MPTTEELFAQAYLHPGDEAPKQVLADRLLEDGDARGEFIALQLRHEKGGLPPSGVKREKRLLDENEVKWLGSTARKVIGHTTRWRHGFLDVCGATLDGTTVGSLEWSTVRELSLYNTDTMRPEELSADFRSLQVLQRANTNALDVLVKAREKPPIRSLSYGGPTRHLREWAPRGVDSLLKLAELPYLKELRLMPPSAQDLNGKDFAFFFDSMLARKLEQLTVTVIRPGVRGFPTPIDLVSFVRGAEGLPLVAYTVEVQGLVSYRFEHSVLTVTVLTRPSMTGDALPVMMRSLRGLDPKSVERFELVYPGKRLAKRHLSPVEEAAKRFSKVNAVEYRSAP